MNRKVHTERRAGEKERFELGKRESVDCVLTIAPTVYPVMSSSCDKQISSYDVDGRWSTAATHRVLARADPVERCWAGLEQIFYDMTSPRSPSCLAAGPELPKRHTTLFERHLSNAELLSPASFDA